ncbi:MFS transporter [Chloroflexota bacterium]
MNGIIGKVKELGSLPMFEALRYRNYRFLFLSSITSSVGMNMLTVAQGWLVLELTDSPFSLGLVWATRMAPAFFFGVLAGSVVDRLDRKKLLISVFCIRGFCALILGILVTTDLVQLWHVLLIALINGSAMVFSLPAQQTFAVDIVSAEGAMNAISINAVGMRVIGIFGGTAAGLIIRFFGLDWPFYIMTLSCITGILVIAQIRGVARTGVVEQKSTWNTYIEGLKLVTTNQIVLMVMLITVVCEILGFSHMVVLPIFARDVLEVGAVGLGLFSTAASIGGLSGGLALAFLGDYRYKGRLILGIFLSFGVFLILFSQSQWFPVSLVFIALIGVTASGMDAVGHTILILSVPENQRGRAMGVWMMSIGFGPIGSITIGAVASAFGAPIAVTINGALIVMTFFILFIFVPQLRRI